MYFFFERELCTGTIGWSSLNCSGLGLGLVNLSKCFFVQCELCAITKARVKREAACVIIFIIRGLCRQETQNFYLRSRKLNAVIPEKIFAQMHLSAKRRSHNT